MVKFPTEKPDNGATVATEFLIHKSSFEVNQPPMNNNKKQ